MRLTKTKTYSCTERGQPPLGLLVLRLTLRLFAAMAWWRLWLQLFEFFCP
ncbi:MAG: hypothetical protein HXX08_07075 [Chloroflexi bacterium]|uniref:Uncharacterized protein n=1 Tax=Candidatus Chlorohelix allophototropha TaxID=3003348 RepID=A0A8T7LUC9_9CHLR|nr:hypothetical protein [Chloroflexota bacterium]WJW67496.1 hypothetical protein OZ401_000762 [Chloroflexota bacterium L227-S17]